MGVRSLVRAGACLAVAAGLITAAAGAAGAAWPRPDRTPPTAPTNFRATAVSQTSVSLAWGPSTDNVGVVSYSVWFDGGNGVQSVRPPQTAATFTGLRPGTSYAFHIAAFDARYNASTTRSVTVTTAADTGAPSSPSGLAVQAIDSGKVRLQWTNGVDGIGPVTHEVLVNGVVTPNAWSTNPPGTPTTPAEGAWIRHLEPGTTYTFTVRAVDGSGNTSAPSNAVTATTLPDADTGAPTAPVLTRVSSLGTSVCPEEVDVRWTGSTDDVLAPTAIEYEIWINGVINDVFVGTTRAIIYTEVNGTNDTTIVAVDRAGNASARSNVISEFTRIGGTCPA
jgi:chitodextrinase